MENKVRTKFKRVLMELFLLAAAPVWAAAQAQVEIDRVTLGRDPYVVRVRLSGETPFKTVQIDSRELMIAFQGARFSEDLQRRGSGAPLVRGIALETPHEGVVTMIVSTRRDKLTRRTTATRSSASCLRSISCFTTPPCPRTDPPPADRSLRAFSAPSSR